MLRFLLIKCVSLGGTVRLPFGKTLMIGGVTVGTMLRICNPLYTPTEVVANIRNSGRQTASLSGKTTNGKAVDAMRALSFINQPAGLSVTIH